MHMLKETENHWKLINSLYDTHVGEHFGWVNPTVGVTPNRSRIINSYSPFCFITMGATCKRCSVQFGDQIMFHLTCLSSDGTVFNIRAR